MSKSQKATSIDKYFESVINDGLPVDADLTEVIKTPPHSGTQRTSSANKLNGVKEMKAQNEEGRVTYIVCTDNGQSLNMDETGNIFLGCGKIGDDESGGNMGIRPHGSMFVKIGDTLNIEIENKQGDEKPLSLKVYGDINLEAEGGDVALKGKNVKITADSQLSLISNDIFVGDTEGACGIVKIATGTLKTDTFFIKNTVNGGITQDVKGEYSINQLVDPRSSFNITSAGATTLTFGNDVSVSSGGRAEIHVAGLPARPIPTCKSPNAFTFTVGTGNSLVSFNAGNIITDIKGGNHTHTTTGNSTNTITGNQTKTISGNHTSTYSGTFNETVSGNTTLTNSGTYTQTITGVHTLTSNAQYTHNITGLASILSKGVMTISGTQINLN